MTPFRYKRHIFRGGKLVSEDTLELAYFAWGIRQHGEGELGFLRLLSNWNRVAARGADRSGVMYVYTPEYTE